MSTIKIRVRKTTRQLKQQVLHFLCHPVLQKVLRNLILGLSFIILIFCRNISGYTSNYNSDLWFYHFTIVERLAMLLLLLSVFKHIKKISWIIGELLFFFLAQDFIDRVFFNVKEISTNDYIAISLIVVIAVIKIVIRHDQSRRTDK